MLHRTFATFLFILLAPAGWAKDAWIQVTTPHFTIVSNGSEKQASRTARQFEQMRLVFEKSFPTLRLDSGAPIYVIAARDEGTMKDLLPEYWQQRGRAKPAGVFQRFWEKSLAIVQLDADPENSYHIIYHEYVHYLMSLSFRRLPVWLDEGIAEFYGNTELREKEARVGLPSSALGYLRGTSWIPLEKMISVTPNSPYYTEQGRAGLFYAEAWLLTHFLVFGKNMNGGALLNEFNKLLQQGVADEEAFRKIFGDPKKVDGELNKYASQRAFTGYIVKTELDIPEKDFVATTLSDEQWAAFLGGFELAERRLKRARPLLEKALARDPTSALANEKMGFLLFHEGKEHDAAQYFAKAYEKDPKAYLSLYYHTMLTLWSANSEVDSQALESRLSQVLELNPKFGPGFIALSLFHARRGNLERARGLAARAVQLEPTRAGYILNLARILARIGDTSGAEQVARLVADRWYGPDQEEAIDVLASLGAKPHDKSEPASIAILRNPNDKVARGTIESVSCSETGGELKLRSSEQTLSFAFGKRMIVGMSDTIWYGSDHFDLCHHLNGSPAVVRYKEGAASSAGEITGLSIRDIFPEAPKKAPEASAVAAP